MMRFGRYVLVGVALLGAGVALAGKPILNLQSEVVLPHFDGGDRSLDEVREAIANGCRHKGWRPIMDGDTQLVCSILVRGRHYAEVKIPFSTTNYSILYSSSRQLDYDAKRQRIHRSYNNWVLNLNQAIQQQFGN